MGTAGALVVDNALATQAKQQGSGQEASSWRQASVPWSVHAPLAARGTPLNLGVDSLQDAPKCAVVVCVPLIHQERSYADATHQLP